MHHNLELWWYSQKCINRQFIIWWVLFHNYVFLHTRKKKVHTSNRNCISAYFQFKFMSVIPLQISNFPISLQEQSTRMLGLCDIVRFRTISHFYFTPSTNTAFLFWFIIRCHLYIRVSAFSEMKNWLSFTSYESETKSNWGNILLIDKEKFTMEIFCVKNLDCSLSHSLQILIFIVRKLTEKRGGIASQLQGPHE